MKNAWRKLCATRIIFSLHKRPYEELNPSTRAKLGAGQASG